MLRLSLIDHGPRNPPNPIAPIFPATAFFRKDHMVTGCEYSHESFASVCSVLVANTRGSPICVDLSRKAFENVLDKYQSRNIFLSVKCYDVPVSARNKGLVFASTLLIIGSWPF